MIRQAHDPMRRRWRTIRPSSRSQALLPALVSRTQVFLAAKAAAGIAWAVALVVSPHSRPYFAPLAVILIVQPTVYDSLSRAVQRVVEVVLGVSAALVVGHFLTLSGWSISIIIFAASSLAGASVSGPKASYRSRSAPFASTTTIASPPRGDEPSGRSRADLNGSRRRCGSNERYDEGGNRTQFVPPSGASC